MTFGCAYEVREEIAKYVISRGVALKFVRSELGRIGAKCEDRCPFLLYVNKDGSNPLLAVNTLVLEHKYYRIFSNQRAAAKFLAKLYKKLFLEKHNYKVKDQKQDAKESACCTFSM